MWFLPRTEGTANIRAAPPAFVAAFVRRVQTGLLVGTSPRRNRYAVTCQRRDVLAFRATDGLTAANVGLNDVELSVSSDRRVRYTIQYRRWAAYAVIFSGAMGLGFIAFLLLFDIHDYVQRHPQSMIPGLSTEQNVAIGWAMAIFWGFVFPWILIGSHKKPVRRLMERLIAEVDTASTEAEGARSPH